MRAAAAHRVELEFEKAADLDPAELRVLDLGLYPIVTSQYTSTTL